MFMSRPVVFLAYTLCLHLYLRHLVDNANITQEPNNILECPITALPEEEIGF